MHGDIHPSKKKKANLVPGDGGDGGCIRGTYSVRILGLRPVFSSDTSFQNLHIPGCAKGGEK